MSRTGAILMAIALTVAGFVGGRASAHPSAHRPTCVLVNSDYQIKGVVQLDDHTAIVDRDTNWCIRE